MRGRRRVLIVGGSGFIGRHLCAAFSRSGAEVVVLDRSSPSTDVDMWIRGCTSDRELMAKVLSGCQTVIFLACSSLPGLPAGSLSAEIRSDVEVAVSVAEMSLQSGVECFLFASSGGAVYGDHNNPEDAFVESAATRPRSSYGVSKLAIEHYLRILGERDGRMRTMCLRISNPYGEGQRARRGQGFVAAVMESALTGSVLEIWGDDQIERDFVHVSDVAEAFVRAEAVVGAPAVLNVGSGRAVSLGEIIACVEEATGYPVRKRLVGPRSVDVRRNVLDISAAWRTLGWRPSVSLKDGLARTATWWAEVRVAEGAPLAERVDRTADEQSSGIKALGS